MLGRAWLAVFVCLAGCTALRGLDAPPVGDAGGAADASFDAHRADAAPVDSGPDVPGSDSDVDAYSGVDAGCMPSDPLVGTACDGADSDLCNEGTVTCALGVRTCSDATSDSLETCGGMLDEDCDGTVDEAGAVGIRTWYPDDDGDGVGADTGALMLCARPSGDRYVNEGGDCDDTNNEVRPGRAEDCDGLDGDCDGVIDDGANCEFGCVHAAYGGHAYQFCALTRSQSVAESRCVGYGYHLVQIDDAAENAFVHSAFDLAPVTIMDGWIGLEATAAGSRVFRWPDGTAPVYTAWGPAEPSGTGDCVRMRSDGTWGDIPCGNNYAYVCEAP